MPDWWGDGIRQALHSTLGWAGVIFGTLVGGFCAGYWIGHRGITGVGQTTNAFLCLPFLWLIFPQIFVAYAVTAVAWYLPLRYESVPLRLTAAIVNFVVWLAIILWIVVQSANAKFVRF